VPVKLSDLILGRPLATSEGEHEQVGALGGVPILGLDALASAAYGPEALLTVLLPLGLGGLSYIWLLITPILVLLVLLFVSYLQTIGAYPGGGGAYTVAKDNLGSTPALLAAASLALDYLLNTCVAISAGVGALVSALPSLLPYTVELCLGALLLLTLVNLRGFRATGIAFMLPTCAFALTLPAIVGIGIVKAAAHGGHAIPIVEPQLMPARVGAVSLWLLLRAFASGCTAMTGVEAVSNGVPIFRRPAATRARRTLAIIIGLLVTLLAGISLLCRAYNVTATPPGVAGYQSVLSQLAAAVVGRGAFYYATLASVTAVLLLSANTSFADLPRLLQLLARDKFLPEAFAHRGRRLAFSTGIIVLAILSAILLIVFNGITNKLIPLFAIGAFLAFTMSQIGMVAHWRKRQGGHARRSLWLNAAGAAATATTLCIMLVSKFTAGAWITVLLAAGFIVLLRRGRRFYDSVDRATALHSPVELGPLRRPIAVVPLRRWDAVAAKALSLALSLAPDVVVVQVLTGDRDADDLSRQWHELTSEAPKRAGVHPPELVVLRSDYRKLYRPFYDYVIDLAGRHPHRQIAVVVPDLVQRRWYQVFLESQTAWAIKALLLYRGEPQIVIVDSPWYLRNWRPERRRLRFMRSHVSRRSRRAREDKEHDATREAPHESP
jgi:amino acid transporter